MEINFFIFLPNSTIVQPLSMLCGRGASTYRIQNTEGRRQNKEPPVGGGSRLP